MRVPVNKKVEGAASSQMLAGVEHQILMLRLQERKNEFLQQIDRNVHAIQVQYHLEREKTFKELKKRETRLRRLVKSMEDSVCDYLKVMAEERSRMKQAVTYKEAVLETEYQLKVKLMKLFHKATRKPGRERFHQGLGARSQLKPGKTVSLYEVRPNDKAMWSLVRQQWSKQQSQQDRSRLHQGSKRPTGRQKKSRVPDLLQSSGVKQLGRRGGKGKEEASTLLVFSRILVSSANRHSLLSSGFSKFYRSEQVLDFENDMRRLIHGEAGAANMEQRERSNGSPFIKQKSVSLPDINLVRAPASVAEDRDHPTGEVKGKDSTSTKLIQSKMTSEPGGKLKSDSCLQTYWPLLHFVPPQLLSTLNNNTEWKAKDRTNTLFKPCLVFDVAKLDFAWIEHSIEVLCQTGGLQAFTDNNSSSNNNDNNNLLCHLRMLKVLQVVATELMSQGWGERQEHMIIGSPIDILLDLAVPLARKHFSQEMMEQLADCLKDYPSWYFGQVEDKKEAFYLPLKYIDLLLLCQHWPSRASLDHTSAHHSHSQKQFAGCKAASGGVFSVQGALKEQKNSLVLHQLKAADIEFLLSDELVRTVSPHRRRQAVSWDQKLLLHTIEVSREHAIFCVASLVTLDRPDCAQRLALLQPTRLLKAGTGLLDKARFRLVKELLAGKTSKILDAFFTTLCSVTSKAQPVQVAQINRTAQLSFQLLVIMNLLHDQRKVFGKTKLSQVLSKVCYKDLLRGYQGKERSATKVLKLLPHRDAIMDSFKDQHRSSGISLLFGKLLQVIRARHTVTAAVEDLDTVELLQSSLAQSSLKTVFDLEAGLRLLLFYSQDTGC